MENFFVFQGPVLHLRRHRAAPTTPLHTAFGNGTPRPIRAQDLTAVLRTSCKAVGPSLGLHPRHISVRALRSGGCMALLRAGVDPPNARLAGRWKSWAMLEHLHADGLDTSSHATKMLEGGDFVLPPHQNVPQDTLSLLQPHLEE